ncbi:MAG TPA: NAD(P)-binding domain-containing protein [Gaiellaceae bacterium]|nr:NAD(P)-binding domain-containing protein [Gaiellaceae bacterium]
MQTVERIETVIVGGGQAGLAVGYDLQRRGRPFVILDGNARVGDSWRRRWPSLRLYSPAASDGLPGTPFPAPRHSFPSGAEMADYLEAYAEQWSLPVRTGTTVEWLERADGGYRVGAGESCFDADNVVVATGSFQHDHPLVPEFAPALDPAIVQLHSADYRGPEQLQDGPVLVVGAAHSGADIAIEVARAGFPTVLAGRDTGQLPFHIEGRLARLGFPVLRFLWTRVLTVRTPPGRKVKGKIRSHGGPLLRVRRGDLAAAGVERVPERVAGVEDGRPLLAGGRALDVANVIWCTGFANAYEWIRLPLPLDDDGFPEQTRGAVRDLPGLYFVGMPFLDSFASMLILGAGRDGERVAAHIAARASRSRAGGRAAAPELAA